MSKVNQNKKAQPKPQTEEERLKLHFQNLNYAVNKFVGTKQEHIMLETALTEIGLKLGLITQQTETK